MLPSDLVNYKKKSRKIIALTAWDSISGSIAEQADVDLVLVGDSLAMVCLGYKSTLPLTLENIIYHTNACLLYTSPSPRDATLSRMPSSA